MCLETLSLTETDQIYPLELNPNSFLAENNSFEVFSGPTTTATISLECVG